MTENGEVSPRVAIFRPDDDRLAAAIDVLEAHGLQAVDDPLLTIDPTGAVPRTDAKYVILTSRTAADLLTAQRWSPDGATLCAIGSTTAEALADAGYDVGIIPETFSSTGLIERLGDDVDGHRVEIARSAHGSRTLPEGLNAAGAYVHETTLYRLTRPAGSGASTERVAAGELDGVLFTSPLTVTHFLEAAEERGIRGDVLAGLDACVVGAIGEPTTERAVAAEIDVDVVPEEASVAAIVAAMRDRLVPSASSECGCDR